MSTYTRIHVRNTELAFYGGTDSEIFPLGRSAIVGTARHTSKSVVLRLSVSLVADSCALLPVGIYRFLASEHYYALSRLSRASDNVRTVSNNILVFLSRTCLGQLQSHVLGACWRCKKRSI